MQAVAFVPPQTPAAVSGALTSFPEQGNEVNTVSHTHSKDGAFRGCLELKRVLRNSDAVGAEQLRRRGHWPEGELPANATSARRRCRVVCRC
jgi:hypothetical protein